MPAGEFHELKQVLKFIDKICLKFDKELLTPMQSMMWIVSIFWGWYLIDIVGDKLGWTQAKWFFPLMLGLPAIIAISSTYKLFQQRKKEEQIEEKKEVKDMTHEPVSRPASHRTISVFTARSQSTFTETELVAMSFTENPLVADEEIK